MAQRSVLGDFDPTQPGDLAQVPERVRLGIAARGALDTFYLATVILGYTLLTVPTHGPLCTFLDTCTAYRRLIQMPRSHFKTTIVTVSHRIKNLLNNAAIRMLIVGNTAPNARKHLGKIKGHFESNALFRWLYPERVWEDPKGSQAQEWSKDSIYIPSTALHGEPTIDAIGARGAAVSRHYDLIDVDDIIGDEEFYSQTDMERTIEWASGLESLFVPPIEQGQMDMPSTFWRVNDVYSFLEEFHSHGVNTPTITGPYSYSRGPLAVFRRGAREDGKVIFPEAVSEEWLQNLQERNPERYAAQYANDPYSSGVSEFKTEWLRYYRLGEPGFILAQEPASDVVQLVKSGRLHIVSMCDPHAGGSQKVRLQGSRAAVMTTGVDAKNARVYILDCWMKRAPTNEVVDQMLYQNEKWLPQIFSVEVNGFQKMLKFWLEERVERDSRLSVPIFEYYPQGDKDGERRIRGLQPLFRAGQIWIQSGMQDFKEEYAAYPRGTKDGLDCLAQGLEHWNIGFDSISTPEYDEYERTLQTMRNTLTGY